MKIALFIDRDGTLIIEPHDEQIDTLEKLEFLPRVFGNMSLIRKNLPFELVMVSNQDGLGTATYPQEAFDNVQQKILKAFENEGVTFDDIRIDKSRPEENKPTRKPGTGMLTSYMNGDYDLTRCFVIGDRVTDIQLAKNIGSKGILINDGSLKQEIEKQGLTDYCALITSDWDQIYACLASPYRIYETSRVTNETSVHIKVNLDGKGKSVISTGLKFFDHMLEQIGRHSGIDLEIRVKGDLEVDEHHTIEDTALALGETIKKALGNKSGISRYGFCLPMDDCLAQVAIDFGGRPWLVWEAEFKRERIGDVPAEMFYHFFKSFSDSALCNLNIKAEGINEHHKIESIFKALAKSIKMAIKRDIYNFELPTTKGII